MFIRKEDIMITDIKHAERGDLRIMVPGFNNYSSAVSYVASHMIPFSAEPWPDDWYAIHLKEEYREIAKTISEVWGEKWAN